MAVCETGFILNKQWAYIVIRRPYNSNSMHMTCNLDQDYANEAGRDDETSQAENTNWKLCVTYSQ